MAVTEFEIKAFFSLFFFFNWDSLYARLNSHYKAWKEAHKKRLQDTENLFRKNLQLKDVC